MRRETLYEYGLGEYLDDGRMPTEYLYQRFDRLLDFDFTKELIYTQYILDQTTGIGSRSFPIFGYKPKAMNLECAWLFSGTHGEEPAGPEAIAEEIDLLGSLSKKIPMVIIPLCNPAGRFRDWRYQDEYRDDNKGTSVTDSEHWLLQPGLLSPRRDNPSNAAAEAVTRYVIEKCFMHPPELAIDFHEDTDLFNSYVYSQGLLGKMDTGARKIVEIMKNGGMNIQMDGQTNWGEQICDGVISNVIDGSIMELITVPRVFYKGQVLDKPYAKSAFVVETPVYGVALPKRVEAHRRIIRSLEEIWEMVER